MGPLEIIEEFDVALQSSDPLTFPGYAEKLASTTSESVRTGRGEHAVIIQGDFSIFGGSMGVVHGEKVVRAIDRAIDLRLPVVVAARSGGARMQEGMVSLIQMGRCADAMGRLRNAGLASIAVLGNPTTGGVFASYASLCDVVAAHGGATIGFAGPRVAQAFTGQSVIGISHSAQSALEAGLIDFVGDEDEINVWLAGALGLTESPLVLRPLPEPVTTEVQGDGAWAQVQAAREIGRPSGLDIAAQLVSSWTELGGTDPTIRAGIATINAQRVIVIAQDRYANTGRTTPAGFALARRAIALAGRRGLPIVTLIDTPGAEPGSIAEQQGIARSIAQTFLAMTQVQVPTVGVCVGEGGSGGALALGMTDKFLMQSNAIFSVIAPEGAASILHRDALRAAEVAELLKLTSADLLGLGIIDEIVADDKQATIAAIIRSLDDAEIGRRRSRFDEASARWITA